MTKTTKPTISNLKPGVQIHFSQESIRDGVGTIVCKYPGAHHDYTWIVEVVSDHRNSAHSCDDLRWPRYSGNKQVNAVLKMLSKKPIYYYVESKNITKPLMPAFDYADYYAALTEGKLPS